jgi:tetratricopeptide (TPR) repeat protein
MPVVATMAAVLLLASLPGTEGLEEADLLRQAEAAFLAGTKVSDNPQKAQPLFYQAAGCYEKLRQRVAHNTELYRNLGNAYLLAGDLPRALLAYRRGLRLAPADADLRANLAHARAQVAYPGPGGFARPAEEILPPWLLPFSLRQHWLLFFGMYSVGWLGLVRWWMIRRTLTLAVGIVAFGLATVVLCSAALALWNERQEAVHPVVVIAQDHVLLRKGNGVLYPPRYETPLNRGVEARLRFERADWLQIELAGGQMGWVPRAAVLLDVPYTSFAFPRAVSLQWLW